MIVEWLATSVSQVPASSLGRDGYDDQVFRAVVAGYGRDFSGLGGTGKPERLGAPWGKGWDLKKKKKFSNMNDIIEM